jgi:hypothetical protein
MEIYQKSSIWVKGVMFEIMNYDYRSVEGFVIYFGGGPWVDNG